MLTVDPMWAFSQKCTSVKSKDSLDRINEILLEKRKTVSESIHKIWCFLLNILISCNKIQKYEHFSRFICYFLALYMSLTLNSVATADMFPISLTLHRIQSINFPTLSKYLCLLEICYNNQGGCGTGLFFLYFWPRVLNENWQWKH